MDEDLDAKDFHDNCEISDAQHTLSILKDVVAFVDVRTKCDNRSRAIAVQLELLGATVLDKFEKNVTHVVFKDGTKSTYDKATKRGVTMVSVLWVESCREQGKKVDEADYAVLLPEGYSTPTFISRIRKFKSMQPRSFEDDLALSNEKVKRRINRLKAGDSGAKINEFEGRVLAPETVDKRLSRPSDSPTINLTIPDTPTSMMRHLERLRLDKNTADSSTDCSTVASPLIKDSSQPLERKLFDNDEDSTASALSPKLVKSVETQPESKPKRRLLSAKNIVDEDLIRPVAKDQNSHLPRLIHTPKVNRRKGQKRERNNSEKENGGAIAGCEDTQATRTTKRRKTCDSRVLASRLEQIGAKNSLGDTIEPSVVTKMRRRSVRTSAKAKVENFSKSLDSLGDIGGQSSLNSNDVKINEVNPEGNAISRKKARPSIFEFKTSKSKWNKDKMEKLLKDFDSPPDVCSETSNQRDDVEVDNGTLDLSESFGDMVDTLKVQIVKPNRPMLQAKKKSRYIVTTSLHTQEQEIVISAVKSLGGGFSIVESVGELTTHVVCGDPRRTLNLLAGIARGCWILSKEWVMRSIENGSWLDEAEFEMSQTFPAAKISRLRGAAQPPGCGIFKDTGCIHVSRDCNPPKVRLESLLTWSGAEVTSCIRKAKVNIVPDSTHCHPETINVTPNWVLDCIMRQECLSDEPYRVYRLKKAGSPEY